MKKANQNTFVITIAIIGLVGSIITIIKFILDDMLLMNVSLGMKDMAFIGVTGILCFLIISDRYKLLQQSKEFHFLKALMNLHNLQKSEMDEMMRNYLKSPQKTDEMEKILLNVVKKQDQHLKEINKLLSTHIGY